MAANTDETATLDPHTFTGDGNCAVPDAPDAKLTVIFKASEHAVPALGSSR